MLQSFENFPAEIGANIGRLMTPETISAATQVSRSWQRIFSDTYILRSKIINDFGIPKALLESLAPQNASNAFFGAVCQRLAHLQENSARLPKHLWHLYQNPDNKNLLLLCCMDDPALADQRTPIEYKELLLELSLYAGCKKIPQTLLLQRRGRIKNYLYTTAKAGDINNTKFLLEPEHHFMFAPSLHILNAAIQSGNSKLVEFLLNSENKYRMEFNQDTLSYAAQTLEVDSFEKLVNLLNMEVSPGISTLFHAASSGSLEKVKFLLEPQDKFNLSPDLGTLSAAALSGNLELVKYLLTFNLQPDTRTLSSAAESGNVKLVQFFLDPTNDFDHFPAEGLAASALKSGELAMVEYVSSLPTVYYFDEEILSIIARLPGNDLFNYALTKYDLTPNQESLDEAATAGNLPLVRFLVDPKKNFGLKPTQNTLLNAIQSENLELVRHLIDPNQNYHLIVDSTFFQTVEYIENEGIAQCLIPSEVHFAMAVGFLAAGDMEFANNYLALSRSFAPNHFNTRLDHLLKNSDRYGLMPSVVDSLMEKYRPEEVAYSPQVAQ